MRTAAAAKEAATTRQTFDSAVIKELFLTNERVLARERNVVKRRKVISEALCG
jgi:hypothetical protein